MGDTLEKTKVGAPEISQFSNNDTESRFDEIIQIEYDIQAVNIPKSDQTHTAEEVGDLVYEDEIKLRTEQLLGRIAVLSNNSRESEIQGGQRTLTLSEALQHAAEGDKVARRMVEENVRSDYFERAYKSGHVRKTELTINEDNQIMQHGQTMDDVHINSLLHTTNPVLMKRGHIEAHNGQRVQYYYEKGLLKDNFVLIHSRVPDSISTDEAEKLGYFTETMSCAIQAITEEDGKIVLYSAFVAGSDSPAGERFDGAAIEYSAATRGVNLIGANADEMLARPELVRKKNLDSGFLSFVKAYDQSTSRFYGREHKGLKDYEKHFVECQRRERDAEELIESVVDQLIIESAQLRNPAKATKRLDYLNDQLLKKTIFSDMSIDSNVLGRTAQHHVEQARTHLYAGNYERMEQEIKQAKLLGRSSSCPNGSDFSSEYEEEQSSKQADCEFISKECPKCKRKNVKTVCKDGKYEGACGCKG